MDNNEELPSFENYQVLRELGRGGMGVVYLAEDKRLNRQVALKVIHAAKVHSISKDQIINEAKILANLNHANIVHLYDIVEEQDSIALVMEYVDGIDLKRAIVEQYASLEQKIIWLRQIAQALECAHDHNILHRDIKPENILVSNSNIAKLSDFGISEVISGTPTRSFKEHSQNKSEKFSSLLTLAPEEINGASVDTKSDLFSLGCVCYTLLCGKHPFVTGSVINKNEIIKNILHNEPINPKDFNPNIPAEICTLVVSLLQKEKSQRPPNAADVVGRLVAHEKNPNGLNDVDLTETLPTSELYKAPTGFPAWLKSTLAMLVVVVCCVAGYWIYDSRPIEKKYVAIYEPALWDSEGVSDIEKELLLRASVWIREYLLIHPNISVLESGVSEGVDISIEDFISQSAADEIITIKTECFQSKCNLISRVLESDRLVIREELNEFFLPSEYSSVKQFINVFVANSFGKIQGLDIDIKESDLKEYLILYEANYLGGMPYSELLERISQLYVREPAFPGIYEIWISVLLKLYNDSANTKYLDKLQEVLSYEKKFSLNGGENFYNELLLLIYKGEHEQALKLISNVERKDQKLEDIVSVYASYYKGVGEYSKASEYYQKLIAYRPSAKNYYNAALNYWWGSDYSSLDETLSDLFKVAPDYNLAIKLQGASYLSQGKLNDARVFFQRAISVNKDGETLNNIGLTYLLSGSYELAVEKFEQAVKIVPEDPVSRLNLAESYLLVDDSVKSSEQFQQVIQLTENSKDFAYNLTRAQALAHQKKFGESIELIKLLERNYSEDVELLYTSSIVYSLVGDVYSARSTAKLAVENGLGLVWLNLPWFDRICNRTDSVTDSAGVDQLLNCFESVKK